MKKAIIFFLVLLFAMAEEVSAQVEWTVWEGEVTKGNVEDLYPVDFANIAVGDKICVYGTGTLSQGLAKKTGANWDWNNINEYSAIPTGTESNYYYNVDESLVNLLGDSNLKAFIICNWDGGTITKVTIQKKNSMIKTVLSNEAKTTSTFEYTIPSSSLENLVEGDYLYIAATRQNKADSESYKLEFKNGAKWNYYTTIYNFHHDMWWSTTSDTIKNYALYIYGEHYNTTGVYLYHPVSSFSIGSIGYATFSASQEVTAPASVTAYRATVSDSKVVLTPFTNNVIPAHTGAIIAGDKGAVLEFTATSTGSTETSDLIAVTSATDVSGLDQSYTYYVLYAGTAASQTDLPLSKLLGGFGGWNGKISWDSGTNTATYTESTGSGEGGWVGADWSAYDKLKLNFSSNTLDADATFYVAYQGHDDATTEATLSQGTTSSIEIELNSNYKNAIGNFSMFSNATTGSITFESAALIDNDGATVAEFRKTTSGTLAANKAYLKINKINGNDARVLTFVFDDDSQTTGIQQMNTEIPSSEKVYYNLKGMRVAHPTKGLYIVNGKKVIVK
jgi:hypothetical protein